MLTQWALNLWLPWAIWVWCSGSELAMHVLLGSLKSLYGHALLVLTEWFKSQDWSGADSLSGAEKFKDIPSSTWLESSERRAPDLNGWGCRFNIHWGNILLLDFLYFHAVQPLMPILPLLPILRVCEKVDHKIHLTLNGSKCGVKGWTLITRITWYRTENVQRTGMVKVWLRRTSFEKTEYFRIFYNDSLSYFF